MTSSPKRATGMACVRATPSAQVSNAGAWFLDELMVPGRVERRDGGAQPLPSQITAEEKARLIDEGYARGLADGEAKTRAAMTASVHEALGAVDEAIDRLAEMTAIAPSVLEENIVALAIVVARQIITHEVTVDRELVANLVRRALTEFPIDQSVRIRVNPVDLSLLTVAGSASEAGGGAITGNRDASWLADPRIARGGCLVEGRDRIVDGRVDSALERAYRRMAQVDAS